MTADEVMRHVADGSATVVTDVRDLVRSLPPPGHEPATGYTWTPVPAEVTMPEGGQPKWAGWAWRWIW